jgi:hypothetical protein
MVLTLNQVLSIILTVAAAVVVVFLVLFLAQVRKTARQAEQALAKAQELMDGLKEIEAKVNAGLDDVGQVLQTSKKAAAGLTQAAGFLSAQVARPAARFWPVLLPIVTLALRKLKKRKEKRDGG